MMMCYPTDFVALPNIHQIRRKVRKPHVPCISLDKTLGIYIYICLYTSYIIIHQSDIDSGHLLTSQWKNPESCGILPKGPGFVFSMLFHQTQMNYDTSLTWILLGWSWTSSQQTSPSFGGFFVTADFCSCENPRLLAGDVSREKSAGFTGKTWLKRGKVSDFQW